MIKLTPQAVDKVKEMLINASDNHTLRIFIEPGGCSGFEYGMSIDIPKDSDHLQETSGLRIAVCSESYEYLEGSEVHFDDGLTGKGFEIRNPNAESTCGCGKSFR